MKKWNEIKVGDTIIFSDKFCELDRVKVTKVETDDIPRYISITIDMSFTALGNNKEGKYRVIKNSAFESVTIGVRTLDSCLAGNIYTCPEAYKKALMSSLEYAKSQLEKDFEGIKLALEHNAREIEKVKAIKED